MIRVQFNDVENIRCEIFLRIFFEKDNGMHIGRKEGEERTNVR